MVLSNVRVRSLRRANVNATTTLTLNDTIKPGPSYNNITMPYSSLLTTAIDSNTRIITPTSNFAYDPWIQLTVPTDAVLSTTGTSMAETLIITFITSSA